MSNKNKEEDYSNATVYELSELIHKLNENLSNENEVKNIIKALYDKVDDVDKDYKKLLIEKESNEEALRESNDSMKDINDYLKNITDKLEIAQKEAVESSRAKSVFLNNISHEMRTPMNAILGYTRQLKSTTEEHKKQEFLGIVENNAEALLMLMNDIIDISRLEVDKVKIQNKPVKLSHFVEQLSWVFKVRAGEKNLEFVADMSEDLPAYVEIDQVRMRQVLYNILGNAVKFTQEGCISFFIGGEISEDDSELNNLFFEIEDTGMGINKDDIERIFKPFEQQKDQDETLGGIGLGLSIAQKLTELMGGNIEVIDKKGSGSIFKIILNNVKVAEPPAAKTESEKDNIDFSKVKIMLVDDDKINKRLMIEYLEMLNVEIIEASNGQECLDILENIMPDIIIMDIRMPVMDGITATKHIKANDKIKHIPVIILSATAVIDDENLKEEDYECVITKPVHMNDLVSEIRKFLKMQKYLKE